MKFLDATEYDLRQVIRFIDEHEFMPMIVAVDLDDWINDKPGDHLYSESMGDIVRHLIRLTEGEERRIAREQQ